MKYLLTFLIFFLISRPTLANQPKVEDVRKNFQETLKTKKPLQYFYTIIEKNYGVKAVNTLLAIANSDSESDEFRWASLFGLAKLSGTESISNIRKFLVSKHWFMRDAALRSSVMLCKNIESNQSTCRDDVKKDIALLLKDESLIVRTSAVDTIANLELKDMGTELISVLKDPKNFNKGNPLWINKHVIQTIQKLKLKQYTPELVEFLDKYRTSNLRIETIKALQSLTGKAFPGKTVEQEVFLWKRTTQSEKTF